MNITIYSFKMDTQSSEMNTANIIDLGILRCPISMTLCYDPVIAEDGYTYERNYIESHFKVKRTSPMTNETIGKKLITNFIVKQTIQSVLENNPNLQKEFDESKKENCRKYSSAELYDECESGNNINNIRLLINHGVNVNWVNNMGLTPLLVACIWDYVEVARLLLDNGAEVDKTNKSGMTPLYVASQNGHLDLARLLLEKGADINKTNHEGWTPLHAACIGTLLPSDPRSVNVVQLLIENNADINCLTNEGQKPIDIACEMKQYDIVEKLYIKKNISVSATEKKKKKKKKGVLAATGKALKVTTDVIIAFAYVIVATRRVIVSIR